jgi:hypothetical protein
MSEADTATGAATVTRIPSSDVPEIDRVRIGVEAVGPGLTLVLEVHRELVRTDDLRCRRSHGPTEMDRPGQGSPAPHYPDSGTHDRRHAEVGGARATGHRLGDGAAEGDQVTRTQPRRLGRLDDDAVEVPESPSPSGSCTVAVVALTEVTTPAEPTARPRKVSNGLGPESRGS